MIKGKTKEGFEFSVNPALPASRKFVKALAKMTHDAESGELDSYEAYEAQERVFRFVLGDEQTEAFLEFYDLATDDEVNAAFAEICKIARDEDEKIKNSLPLPTT